MEVSVNQRVKFLIDTLKAGNKSAFAKEIGVGGGVIQDIVGGRLNKPSFDLLTKIVNAYPEINTDWMLTGEGEPFKQQSTIPGKNSGNSGTFNKNSASGNTVSYGTVSASPESSEIDYLRTRVRELEQKNNELMDKILQLLNK